MQQPSRLAAPAFVLTGSQTLTIHIVMVNPKPYSLLGFPKKIESADVCLGFENPNLPDLVRNNAGCLAEGGVGMWHVQMQDWCSCNWNR